MGEPVGDAAKLMILAINIERCIAFVRQLVSLELVVAVFADSEPFATAALNKSIEQCFGWTGGHKGFFMRFKSRKTYLRKYPTRGTAFGLEVHNAKLANAKSEAGRDDAAIKNDRGFKKGEPGCLFCKGTRNPAVLPPMIGMKKVTGLGTQAFCEYVWGDGFALGNDKNWRFRQEGLHEVVCPDGLDMLGHWAFVGSGVQRLGIPGTLKRVDDESFVYCAIKEIVVRGTEKQFTEVSKLPEKALEKNSGCKLVRKRPNNLALQQRC